MAKIQASVKGSVDLCPDPTRASTVIGCMYGWHQCATVIDPRLNLTGYCAGSGV